MITESRETASTKEAAGSRRRESSGPAVTLTARGGIAVIFGLSFIGALIDFSILPGLIFVIACVLAALATKPSELPSFVVAPPAAFFCATLAAEIIQAFGGRSFFQSLLVALPLQLATTALWLLAGTLLALVIAWRRGLLESWKELSTKAEGFRLTQERYVEEDPVRWDD